MRGTRGAGAADRPARSGPCPVIPLESAGRLRILVCDDHEIYRLGFEAVVSAAPDLLVVGHATSSDRAEELAAELAPHVAVVSQDLEGDALALVGRLRRDGVRVVVLGAYRDEQSLGAVFRAGATGFLTRGVVPDRLLEAVRAAGRGETTLDPRLAPTLLTSLHGRTTRTTSGHSPTTAHLSARRPEHEPEPAPALTRRQLVIAELVSEGLSNSDIASRLFLSQATVKSHVTSILKRLGVRDRTQLAILLNRGGVTGGRRNDARHHIRPL